MAQRIQRRRTKGWRMPSGAVYVGRPSVWGNRWTVGVWSKTLGRNIETVEEVLLIYRKFQIEGDENAGYRAYVRERLAGKDLACWCPLDKPCHADVLLEIANGCE